MNIVTRVSNTSRSGVVGVLVDGALQLLQELVDVQQVTLSPEVGQWQGVRVVHGWVLRLSNHCASMTAVLTHAAALVAAAATAEDRKLDTLKSH